jgi:hypothetical protein
LALCFEIVTAKSTMAAAIAVSVTEVLVALGEGGLAAMLAKVSFSDASAELLLDSAGVDARSPGTDAMETQDLGMDQDREHARVVAMIFSEGSSSVSLSKDFIVRKIS